MNYSKFSTVVASVVLVGCLAGCSKPEPAKPPVDTAKIADAAKADVQELIAAFNAHDAAKSVAQDAPGYVGMFHGLANVNGPVEDLALAKQQLADPTAKLAVSNETVDVASAGDMAVYRATYAYSFVDPKTKKPTSETGNWVVGLKSQADGTLKVAWAVVSDTLAAAGK